MPNSLDAQAPTGPLEAVVGRMLLLTYNVWRGPGDKMTTEERERTTRVERLHGYATRLSLSDAIARVKRYETAYNERFHLAITARLLFVAEIDDLLPEALSAAGVDMIEDLPQDLDDF